MLPTPTPRRMLSKELLDVLIRAGLVAVLAIFCFRVFVPFLNLMVWALILAITLYPLQVKLRGAHTGRNGLIATLIVVVAFAVILVPSYLLGVALANTIEHAMSIFRSCSFRIPP